MILWHNQGGNSFSVRIRQPSLSGLEKNKELMNNYWCDYLSYRKQKNCVTSITLWLNQKSLTKSFTNFIIVSSLVQSTTEWTSYHWTCCTKNSSFMRSVCYTWKSFKPCKIPKSNNFKIIKIHYCQRIVWDQVLWSLTI